MFRANRNQPPTVGMGTAKISDYAKSGASHPEGETRLIEEGLSGGGGTGSDIDHN